MKKNFFFILFVLFMGCTIHTYAQNAKRIDASSCIQMLEKNQLDEALKCMDKLKKANMTASPFGTAVMEGMFYKNVSMYTQDPAVREKYQKMASDILDNLVKQYPDEAEAYFFEASKLRAQKDLPGALKAIEKAISLDKTQVVYYENRAAYFLSMNETQKGCADLKKAIDMGSKIAEQIFTVSCADFKSDSTTNVK